MYNNIRLLPNGSIWVEVNGVQTTVTPTDSIYKSLKSSPNCKVLPKLVEQVMTAEEQRKVYAEVLREERFKRLEEVQWIIDRHNDEKALGTDTTLTEAEYTKFLQYKQDLRDVPQKKGFPWDGTFDNFPTRLIGA